MIIRSRWQVTDMQKGAAVIGYDLIIDIENAQEIQEQKS